MSDLYGGDSEVYQEREAQWEQWKRRIETIEAKYRVPIDPKVKEVVTGLNALGIETDYSCEGHAEEGRRNLPLIDICRPNDVGTDAETVARLRGFIDEFDSSRPGPPDNIRLVVVEQDPSPSYRDVILVN